MDAFFTSAVRLELGEWPFWLIRYERKKKEKWCSIITTFLGGAKGAKGARGTSAFHAISPGPLKKKKRKKR